MTDAPQVQGTLLQIVEDGRVIAEAPLYVYDAEAAWKLFSENFGMMAHIIAGGLYNTVRVACHAEQLAQAGPQTAVKLESNAPSKIVVPRMNGVVR